MTSISIVIASRTAMLINGLRQVRRNRYLWIHVATGMVVLGTLMIGGGWLFHSMFAFLLKQEVFGRPLMERLVGMVLLAFFSMLVFSNLVITLTTTYISRDTEFLFTYPISSRSIFTVKLGESLFYSSWAFVLLSLPMFFAYGIAKQAPLAYYPTAFLLGFPFIVIPASIGAVVTMLISACLPARRARSYTFALIVAAVGIMLGLAKFLGFKSLLHQSETDAFGQVMQFLNIGNMPLLPNYWLARGMQAASESHWDDVAYWSACLVTTAAMSVQICLWLVPLLYYRGWTLAKEAAGSPREQGEKGWSPFGLLDRLAAPFSPPVRALIGKDIRTFLRDPAQWSQLVILFGLLIIYISNISGITQRFEGIGSFLLDWPSIISFFNLGATCFVICILTTRFIYPMLSLEGKQYWVVGLAPFRKRKLVWEKFGLCLSVTLPLALILISLSNGLLGVHPALGLIGLVTVSLLAVGLTSLAVGLGALFPDFKQDNPARIANGIGGTANIMLSLIYIGASIATVLPPATTLMINVHAGSPGKTAFLDMLTHSWPWIAAAILIHTAAIFTPMIIGLRRWDRLEIHF